MLFIIVGDFIDAIPAIIIFMPMIIDLTQTADINPVHMGVVIIVTLAFGLITPPYGLALLMASKFVGVKFRRAMFASLPIYIVFFAAIAFCIFFPEVVLWLPKTTAAAIGRLFQESERRRLYLPLSRAYRTAPACKVADDSGLFGRMRQIYCFAARYYRQLAMGRPSPSLRRA